MTADRDPLLLSDEVAALLRVSTRTLADWRQTGYGPAWFPISGQNRPVYRTSAVEAYIKRREQEAMEQQAREHRQAAS